MTFFLLLLFFSKFPRNEDFLIKLFCVQVSKPYTEFLTEASLESMLKVEAVAEGTGLDDMENDALYDPIEPDQGLPDDDYADDAGGGDDDGGGMDD